MQRFITDERTGIRYELIGDYYYPCLTVEESPPLSKYGRLRQRYLREHKRVLYFNLLTSGKLYEHLAEIDTSARDMAEYMIKEMAKKQGVTEELKATDMMRWIGLMNNIRACADESVMVDGKIDMSKVNAISFDPYTHGYYKVTERVGEAFRDGLKLKK